MPAALHQNFPKEQRKGQAGKADLWQGEVYMVQELATGSATPTQVTAAEQPPLLAGELL